MASKLKYQKARLRQAVGTDNEHWADVLPSELIETPPKGDLVCSGCWTLMKRTASFTRAGTEVPAYLSLYPNTEHEPDCRLSIETLQQQLRRDHPDIVSVENKILYLHLPDEERLKNLELSKKRVGGGNLQDNRTETLRSAASIAKFLKQFEDPGDILNRLMIRYRDHRGGISTMFWTDFCFEARSPQALKYLRRLQRDGKHTPPVAVIFPTKATTENKTHRFMRVDTNEKPRPEDNSHQLFLSVAELLEPDKNLLHAIAAESILVLGHGGSFDWSHRNVTELRLTINGRWQFTDL